MQAAAIVVMCVLASITYGVLHDQITARICVEYFTIGHPPVFPTDDPTLLGLGWGIIATWWVGLILGIGLVIAARSGRRPPRSALSLVRPVAWLMAIAGVSAAAMGLIGYALAEVNAITLVEPLATEIRPERHTRFLADLWAHSTSYFVGIVGGLVVWVRVWQSRSATQKPGNG